MPAVFSTLSKPRSGFLSSRAASSRARSGGALIKRSSLHASHTRIVRILAILLLGSVSVSLVAMTEESLQAPAVMSPLVSHVLLTDSAKLPSGRYIGVGLYGSIVYSDDQGETWRQAKSPTQVLLTNVFFLDDKLGWAGAHDTLILHTRDGGETWDIQHEDPIPGGDIPKPILDIHFTDSQTGYAIGAYGLMLETSDGGQSWEEVDTMGLYDRLETLGMEPEPNFNYMIPFENNILIVGELGTILVFDPRADEEAERWQIIESPYEGTFFGATELGSGELYLYGLRGNIYRTLDKGQSWQKIKTGVIDNIYGCTEMPDGTIVFLGSSGTILTMNSGDTKTEKYPYPKFDTKVSAELLAEKDLLMFGSSGVSAFTLN